MVNSLLDLYEAWASEDVPETEYLKVWLMWPELTESQVVMAGATKAEMYQNSFRPVADLGWAESRGFPPQFGFQLLERLNKYDWQECLHEYTVDRQDVSDAWLKKRPYSNLSSEEGLFSVLVEVGRIWVGTRRVFVNG